jgi:regulator of cell morphogenesis and NO signaling
MCQAQHVDLSEICGALTLLETAPEESAAEAWAHGRLGSLVDHIVATHHEFLRRELPRLTGLLEKVRQAHGEKHPDLAELQIVFRGLADEWTAHMEKEERILFPWIRRLEADQSVTATLAESVNEPIRVMEHEHRTVPEGLAKIRRLTNDFVPPADACPTCWTLLDGRANLEQDLHLHIHKENNILFPRAAELEMDELEPSA